ncbi:hypothetical protein NC651_037139 [Populus alba x Populus x berolinensis]|nr:hypothetical protein NC651_037123 [Populus alba x Populus x berolinensis]KAJ6860950.1 hypothetical protein NC651_037131 [Populus alba x Populus x berolinensis]KAJ6860958.1 hypothetical protein NC651_037139 [Populus alba x Populus x berolinensis]
MDDMHYLLTLSTKITPRFIRIPAQELFCCNRIQHHHLIIQAGSQYTTVSAEARNSVVFQILH